MSRHARWLLLPALFALGCAQSAPGGMYYAGGNETVTVDGLRLVDWEPFRVTYVKPGADIRRFDRLMIEDPTISYRKPPKSARLGRVLVDPNYALTETARERLIEIYRDVFTRALGRSESFTITDAPGPDVLRIAGHIVDLKITVPPERAYSVDDRYYASTLGRMALVADASDSMTGEPLFRVGQSRAIETSAGSYHLVDPTSTSFALLEIFGEWAEDLRRGLDHFHALPRVPEIAGQPPGGVN